MRKTMTLMHANNKGTVMSSYSHSLISASDIKISKLTACKISFFKLVSVSEQNGLSFTQPETHKTGFSRGMAKMCLITYFN